MNDLLDVMERVRRAGEDARVARADAQRLIREARSLRVRLRSQVSDLARKDGYAQRHRDSFLMKVLIASMRATCADRGNIQIHDAASNQLMIQVQSGFEQPFLNYFSGVHSERAVCGTAFRFHRRIVVEDVVASTIFDPLTLEVLLDARVRAVQSTPLLSGSGRIIGMLSTHYEQPRALMQKELRNLDSLAQTASTLIEWYLMWGVAKSQAFS